LLEKKRFPAAGRFHLAVCPFRDEQIRVDRNADAFQLARLFKRVEKVSK
jgi:hypothetical protein